MHELSIAHSLIELADQAACDAGAARLIEVHVRIGALCGVVGDALEFCFTLAAAGTRLAGAKLVLEELPVQI